MTYAYDNYVQLPVVDLYDSSIMQMAIAAAKDQYDRGQKQIEDFYTKYGDFMSPFAKDMERYGLMMGGINNILNDAYSKGIDLTKSPEGRALINRLVYSVNPQEYNMMRSNAKTGYAYLDAILKLRSQGKYSEAQELFDIMQNGGTKFSDFGTYNPETGTLNSWDRTSPIEATSLLDLTYKNYEHRTPRDLTPEDLKAARIPYDPRYQYTGYLDSDLMKVAPGAAMALAGDPRAAFFREEAKQMVIARGEQPTEAAIEAQFLRNIADANKWALVDPIKKTDDFAKSDYEFKHAMALQKDALNFLREMKREEAKDKLDLIYARYGRRGLNGGKDNESSPNYSLTESIHHDLLFQGLRNSGIGIPELTTDSNGNVIPKKDDKGNIIYKNPDNASWTELEYAANKNNAWALAQLDFFSRNTADGNMANASSIESKLKKQFGARITGVQLAGLLKRQIQKDGSVLISEREAELLRGSKGLIADGLGSHYNMTYDERIRESRPANLSSLGEGDAPVEIKFSMTDTGNNAVQISEKYNGNRSEIYVNGSVTYTKKDSDGQPHSKTIRNVWLPIGINSEKIVKNKSNLSLSGANLGAYDSINANYLKQLGQQQKVNIGLLGSSLPMMIDPSTLTQEDLLELYLNNQ